MANQSNRPRVTARARPAARDDVKSMPTGDVSLSRKTREAAALYSLP